MVNWIKGCVMITSIKKLLNDAGVVDQRRFRTLFETRSKRNDEQQQQVWYSCHKKRRRSHPLSSFRSDPHHRHLQQEEFEEKEKERRTETLNLIHEPQVCTSSTIWYCCLLNYPLFLLRRVEDGASHTPDGDGWRWWGWYLRSSSPHQISSSSSQLLVFSSIQTSPPSYF